MNCCANHLITFIQLIMNQGSTSAECVGQGLANLASSLTGGMGGCALIGQSLINLDSGGRTRLSGVSSINQPKRESTSSTVTFFMSV